jgi:hypothetical protein
VEDERPGADGRSTAAILAWELWRLFRIAALGACVVDLVRDTLRELSPGRTS